MAIATSTAIALALAAAASGASYYNTRQTQKKQDAIALQGLQTQRANQAEAKKRTQQLLDDESKSGLASNAATAQGNYAKQVQAQLAQANAGLTERGLNADFDARAGGAAQQNADWGAMAAKLLGTIDGAQLQRDAEAKLSGNAGMDYNVLRDKAGGDQWVNGMRMKAVRRNPYIDLAAGLLGGAANGVAAGGGSGATNYGSQTAFDSSADLGSNFYGTSGTYAGGAYT